MMRNGIDRTPGAQRRTLRARGGRRLLAPLASLAATAALLAGCSTAEEPPENPTAGTSEETGEQTEEETAEGPEGGGEEPQEEPDGTSTDAGSDGGDSDDEATSQAPPEDDSPSAENLFEGTWGFGHDTKVLSAEELGDLIENEAEDRGPEEISLEVECGDGVDTGAGDLDAECIAYADEGVEHLWRVTVGPADAGLVIEVENAT